MNSIIVTLLSYIMIINCNVSIADDKSDLTKAQKEITILKQINTLQKKNSDIDAEKIKILSSQNDKLAEKLQSSREMSTWEKAAWVTLGILATVGGAAALSHIH